MSHTYTDTNSAPALASRTRVLFDLADVLTPEEIVKFETAAKEAGAKDLTEHFLNLTLRLPHQEGKAA